jgi:hypothetical protein
MELKHGEGRRGLERRQRPSEWPPARVWAGLLPTAHGHMCLQPGGGGRWKSGGKLHKPTAPALLGGMGGPASQVWCAAAAAVGHQPHVSMNSTTTRRASASRTVPSRLLQADRSGARLAECGQSTTTRQAKKIMKQNARGQQAAIR